MIDFFDIRFVANNGEAVSQCRYGEMHIGALCERFLCDVSFWVGARYERQWLETAARLVNGKSGVFLTSITEPSNSTFIRWWAAYREGDSVVLQEQICFLDELSEPLDLDRPEEALRPRETVSEDGQPISEWTVTLSALQDFLHRLAARCKSPTSPLVSRSQL